MKKNILDQKYNSGPTKLCPICARFVPVDTNGCLLPHKNILDQEYCKGVDLYMNIMTKEHSRWSEFIKRLHGSEGCDFKENIPGDSKSITWRCSGGDNKNYARRILEDMGFDNNEIELSLKYFEGNGGYCDCEILFNVTE